MKVAPLIAVLLGLVVGCDRQQQTETAPAPAATSQPTEWQPPASSLDAVFAEIVRTDWQTEGQWEPRSPKPPLDFISKVRDESDFRRVDLDGDGVDERIICLNFSPGQKPINQTFWVAQKTENGWAIVGKIEGEPKTTPDTPRSGMQPLDATWYNGGFEYKTTRYEFKDGHYVAGVSKRWRPTEGS
jgi:hypothetical protein